jgi:branched-chain amino acid transport system permease protein
MTTFYEENKRYITWALYIALVVILVLWLGPLIADKKPSRLIQSTVTGLLVGGIYALIALGIVIINKASGVFNFAHGGMMLIGGMIFYSFFTSGTVSPVAAVGLSALVVVMSIGTGSLRELLHPRNAVIAVAAFIILSVVLLLPGVEWQWPRAIVGGLVGAVLMGLMIERFTIRPLIGQPLFAALLMTLGLASALRGVTNLIWGSVELPLQIFNWIDTLHISRPISIDATSIGGKIIVRTELLVAFGLALIAFAGFVLFFQFTTTGLAMRATSENQKLAQSVGLRVRVILATAWAIASLLALIGGVLLGGTASLSLNLPGTALLAFPAVLLGGLESIGGALVGGLMIGVIQEWANLLFPGTQAGTELAPYVTLMIVLIIRPDGLFGQKRIERI